MIEPHDLILTFAKSKLLSRLFLLARSQHKVFTVIVVDNPPYFEGRQLA